MPKTRYEVPEIDVKVSGGQKKFVRYKEGVELYSLGRHTFEVIAKEAGAVYRVKRCVLVNTQKVDEYLENFCDGNNPSI
ncbi:DUF6462 family protein [Oribacterium sp. WCC10]|uniref:DUF6462 family protein n=1 Tax=Oribacterium sp. WCC10 TaxID=1855343 RepID=UPI0008ED134B|nr:DUF6462 family protein [Oribacterium sp. WCC10]SFG82347.1 hypothetical protein SAMN05216356_13811 [Oribacterium sp. WCC10]